MAMNRRNNFINKWDKLNNGPQRWPYPNFQNL